MAKGIYQPRLAEFPALTAVKAIKFPAHHQHIHHATARAAANQVGDRPDMQVPGYDGDLPVSRSRIP